jgi:hypothetical protein
MTQNKTFEGTKKDYKAQVLALVGACVFEDNKSYFRECLSMQLPPDKAVKYLICK